MEKDNTMRGFGKRGRMFSIKSPLINSTNIKCIEFEYGIEEDRTKMYLQLLNKAEILLNLIESRHLILSDREGNMNLIDLNDLKEFDENWIRKIIKSKSIKIFEDAKPILKFLNVKKYTINGPYFDIKLATQLLEVGIFNKKYSTDKIEKYLEVSSEDILNQIINNSKALFKLKDKLKVKLQDEEMEEIAEIEFGCIDAIVEMENTGILFDKKLWLDAKQYSRQTTDYSKFINPVTHRIHAEFNQIGSSTGRIISSSPNVQNVSRDRRIRACFRADEGNVFIIGDYSQLELRIVADVANEKVMINSFNEGVDLHTFTASKILNKDIKDISVDERVASKPVNFGLIYAMGAEGLLKYAKESFGINLTIVEAEKYMENFLKTYPGIVKWHAEANNSNAKGIKSLGGRIRMWKITPTLQKLTNSKIQSTSSDIIKKALVILMEMRKYYDLRFDIVNVVHDEIILEVYNLEENVVKTKKILEKAMIKAGEYYLKEVPIEVSIVEGKDWSAK